MDLKAVNEWAKKIDPSKTEEKKRHHVACYRDMVIEKSGAIEKLSGQIGKYMEDIQEYLTQLEKAGVHLPTVESEPSGVVLGEPESKTAAEKSPLIP